jgi:hypothetical protein
MPARPKKKPKKSAKKRAASGRRPKRPAARKPKSKGKKPKRPKAKKPARKPKARPKAKGKSSADKAKKREKLKREQAQKREREKREKERAKLLKQREREKAQRDREKERDKKAREVEKKRELKAREIEKARKEAERAKEKKAREVERQRQRDEQKKAREEERQRREAERERIREEARRAKEEERAKREAEREAYRKAKEAERERLRAEREAAKRALEGKVARATKRAQRAGVGRTSTTRVYRPDAIPNQSGTTRRLSDEEQVRPAPPPVPLPPEPPREPPPPRVELPETIEERFVLIQKRLGEADEAFRREYQESFDMSWIYHDSALEGTVYTFQELKTAIDPSITVVPDSSLQPVCEEIRRHKAAIELVRELGEKKRATISVDTIKKIFLTLHPEEGDLKSVKYRKDIPQHRLYFHEYAAPDKIAYKVRQVIDWLNGPEPKKIKHPLRIASRVHYDLLRVFPFALDSGKVVRLLMNLILLRSGYPPSIIHSTERQRYYEALKSSLPTIASMMNEAILNGLASIEKKLDEHDLRR